MVERKDRQRTSPDSEPRRDYPTRPGGEPDTLEGPGGRHESNSEEDARDKATRQGER
jgi:hypothetical protein